MKRKRTETLVSAAILGFWIGSWMVFDGMYYVVVGDYLRINGQLGPWVRLVSALKVTPADARYVLIVLGVLWIAAAVGLLMRKKPAWYAAVALSGITLLYCCIGTVVSALVLVMLLLKRTRTVFDLTNSEEGTLMKAP
jgi:uncharacterized membrane protein HdeD (DUF308 family)